MSWQAKVQAAIVDLQAALISPGYALAHAHLNDARDNVTFAIDALDDARASEAT